MRINEEYGGKGKVNLEDPLSETNFYHSLTTSLQLWWNVETIFYTQNYKQCTKWNTIIPLAIRNLTWFLQYIWKRRIGKLDILKMECWVDDLPVFRPFISISYQLSSQQKETYASSGNHKLCYTLLWSVLDSLSWWIERVLTMWKKFSCSAM